MLIERAGRRILLAASSLLVSLAMAAVSAPTQFTRPRVRQTQEGHSAQVRSHQFYRKIISLCLITKHY